MESPTISSHEYFNIFKGMNSPVFLRDKLKLMEFIMRESNEYSSIDINILFELFESHPIMQKHGSKSAAQILHGEKYIITYLLSKMSEEKMAL